MKIRFLADVAQPQETLKKVQLNPEQQELQSYVLEQVRTLLA